MRKIDPIIQQCREAQSRHEDAATARKEAEKLLDAKCLFPKWPAGGVSIVSTMEPDGLEISIDGALSLDDLDKVHAWAHDMLDEQPE